MLDVLNFVKGAVARKDFVPALQHFKIQGGYILAFNGTIGLCSPIPVDIDCAPLATTLRQAIESCTQPVALSLTDKGRLLVTSGDFKTFVDTCDLATFPPYAPSGPYVKLESPILPALGYLEPFIAEDASRPWACGILFAGSSAYATNHVVLQEYWLGTEFPCRVNVPGLAIRELLRIGVEPLAIQVTDNRATFHYEKDRWLTTQLYETAWPDVTALLTRESNQAPFAPGFFDAIERLLPFVDEIGRVYFHGERISTSADPDTSGTTIDIPGVPATGCFNARQLLRLEGVAHTIDFSAYPEPSLFYGEVTRGLLVGIRT